MARYRIDVLDHQGSPFLRASFVECSDEDAIKLAIATFPYRRIDLWDGDRLVSRLEATAVDGRWPNLRVLVVEDEYLAALSIEEAIREIDGVMVGPVGRLSQALAAAERDNFDIAMLDLNLRGEMSFAVAEALSRRGKPFCFVSGFSRSKLPPNLKSARFLAKPCQAPAIKELLGQLGQEAAQHRRAT